MESIKTIFWDLDHTLWDFERNSGEALRETLYGLNLVGRNGLEVDDFIERYHVINDRMWDEYRRGLIEKEDLRARRFDEALGLYGIREEGLGERFASMYLDICPRKKNLFPYANEVLEKLSRKYPQYIITNGFSEVQSIKMNNDGLSPYIRRTITSEEAGAKKPSPVIFEYAMREVNATPSESIMIGDDLDNDVIAALNAGFARGIWFNPTGKNRDIWDDRIIEIHTLAEILEIIS
ncbi:MAG: YjjG family noncanonical pyrimidine nucleotidase [Flavobacteriales bacterium]|nr:YjjG family noncanonical pyrimidine nucleotidase [Flavobacteriales bacterium]